MTREECKGFVRKLIEDEPRSFCNIIRTGSVGYDDVRDFIFYETPLLSSDEYLWGTRIYWFMNDLTEFPYCAHPDCNNTLEHHNVVSAIKGFTEFCCRDCANTSPQHYERIKNTVKKMYGVDNVFQTKWANDKRRDTMISKYGAEFTQQFPELIKKCQESCMKHYGVKHQWLSDEIKEKNKATLMERYGTDNVFDLSEVREKQRVSFRVKHYNDFLNCKNVKPNFTLEEYINCKDPVHTVFEWICLENGHNHVFTSIVDSNNFTRYGEYARCWDCHPNAAVGISNEELSVLEFIKSITDRKVIHQEIENRKIIPNREIDILIPEIKLGMEFDGLYYHSYGRSSEQDEKSFREKHVFKTDYCDKIGWKLVHIFENEWIVKNEIVKSKLRALLGLYDRCLTSDECVVKEISTADSNRFLEENHIQGKCKSSIKIGLFSNDELVSVMTFGKRHSKNANEYELLRFSLKMNTNIEGASAKLINYFEKNYKPTKIITYVDRRWPSEDFGGLGFKSFGNTEPNYYYVKGITIYNNKQFKNTKLSDILENYDETKTEKENMLLNNYRIIYDCGNMIFTKTYDKIS